MAKLDKLKQRAIAAQAELDKIRKRIRPLADRGYGLEEELRKLQHSIKFQERRERLGELVGQQVQTSSILSRHNKLAWMNTAVGTLESIGRTRCLVDFGDRGKWYLPIMELQSAGEPRSSCDLFAMGDGTDLSEMGI